MLKKSDQEYDVEQFANVENTEDVSETTKRRFGIKIAAGVTVVLAVAAGATYFSNGLDILTIKQADIVEFSAADVEDHEIYGISSECFYSTQKERAVQNKIKVFSDNAEFQKWYESHHDITRTKPSGLEECTAATFFNKGYYAAVISPTDLFDPDKTVLATAKYQNESGDIVIALSQMDRDPSYQYDKDLKNECQQIYTILYLNPEDVKNAENLTFAIDKS